MAEDTPAPIATPEEVARLAVTTGRCGHCGAVADGCTPYDCPHAHDASPCFYREAFEEEICAAVTAAIAAERAALTSSNAEMELHVQQKERLLNTVAEQQAEIERVKAELRMANKLYADADAREDEALARIEALADQVGRLREALQWRPVASAPKDTPLLVGRAGNTPIRAALIDGRWKPHLAYDTTAEEQINSEPWAPTHWMPLPNTAALSPTEPEAMEK